MKTVIKWHKTSEEMPKPTHHCIGNLKWEVDEPLLVILEGRVKPSRWLSDQKTWEGHTKTQIPEYWIMLKELTFFDED